MDETRIDTLTIEIGASSDKAVREIEKLSGVLGKIQTKAKQTTITPKVSGTEDVESKSGGFLGWLKEVSNKTKERFKIKVDAKDAEKASKKVGLLTRTLNALKRIAFYRLIRTAIKELGDAFREGQENAYWYSKTVGEETKYISEAYDNLASASFKMKNQLGAAWATLRTAITPVLLEIVSLITTAANAITQFFAVLGGKSTYLKAIDYAKDWADETTKGAKAAKEWKNQLLGFDVINRLEEPSAGGASTLKDYENMFEEAKVEGWAQKIQEFIGNLKFNFKDVLFSWGDLTGEQIAKKVITGLGALVGASVGFIIGGVPGAVTGSIIGASLGLAFSSLIFDNDGVLSRNEVLKMVCTIAGALAGGAVGFSVGGPAGAAIGAVVGAMIGINAHSLVFGSSGEGKEKALRTLITSLSAIAGGVIGFALGGPLGALIGVTVGAGIGLLVANAGFKKGVANQEQLTRTVVSVLSVIAGGLIGFKLGGPFGAIIGATIGAGISLLVVNAAFYKGTQQDNKRLATTLVTVLSALVGGVLGFAIGGPLGAVLGVTIGSGLSLAVTSAMFDDNGKSLKEKILSSLVAVLGALTGGAIGFVLGGPLGAVIGASIGIGITLFADSVAWDAKSKTKIQNETTNVFSDYVTGKFNAYSSGNVFSDYATGKFNGLYASGGFPEDGLFYANHNELVGKFSNGRTAVANNEQIEAGIARAVYSAVVDAFGQNGGGSGDDRAVNIYLDGKQIAQTTTKYQRQFARVGST